MAQKHAPYGTWDSPVTSEEITKGVISIVDVIVDPVRSEVYHLESRPSEKGRIVLVHTNSNRDIVGPGWNVRTAVQEYGGAAAIVRDGVAYFSHMVDGRVYRVQAGEGSDPEPVTPENVPYRYAAFEPHPDRPELLISILEDHTYDIPSEVITTLIIIDSAKKTIHPLLSGADFYAMPKFSANGRKFAWIQWFHPDMPWEGGEVHVADVIIGDNKTLSLQNTIHVAGVRERVGAGYPAWADNDTLIFMSDESGFVNPWKFHDGKASPLFSEAIPEDFASPLWSLSSFPYAVFDKSGKTGLFSALRDGRNILYLVDFAGNAQPKPIDSPFVVINNVHVVSAERQEVVFSGQKTNESHSIVQCSLTSLANSEYLVLKGVEPAKVDGVPLPLDLISEPQPITLHVPATNAILHVVYYPPKNPAYSGGSTDSEKPPCIVNIHGGPTGLGTQGLSWSKQYWTSRGWAWLDVNYGGSSGYGRKYIERLNNNWGIVDVQDSVFAPQALSIEPYNLIDPKRLIIRGGSAGGFTALACLSIASDVTVFSAATSLYGVSDLKKLAEFTHKFESRYLDHLIGGTTEQVPEIYASRSPIHHAKKIVVPLLILQGEIDMVVPKDQAEAIYKSIRERGGEVEYKLYPGEGHGFRQEVNMKDAYERELAFYERILGLKQN
ncbi:alpha/beta-hydrolase [Gymnopilus junonius]|uniref:Alpha/beta-hydrolase n=1 Tax=Gymnopilus junonius TaxID=109634 RepID=A0A9P5NLG1_GYMJU|nr:alpha/beta-hydrolase [Gymnopilus junonius]